MSGVMNMNSVLITGASSGIGEALALACVRRGAKNLFLCGRNAERLDAVVRACRDAGAQADGRVLDVTDEGAMRAWVEACDATISRVSELQPNVETAKRYDAAFPIYRDLYVALKAQFGAIAGL